MTGSTRMRWRGAPLGWPAQLTGALLGLATGMGVNVLSDDVGYRGVAAASAAVAVLVATSALRGLSPRAPLVPWTSRLLLAVALGVSVVGVAAPAPWSAYAALASAALTTTAVLLASDLTSAASFLLGVAAIGVGVATVGFGAVLFGVAFIGLGVAIFGLGIAALGDGDALRGVAFISIGVALVGLGIAVP